MSESIFPRAEKCNSVKIWSKSEMTDKMMTFGWNAFNRYQKELTFGEVSEEGCVYSNDHYAAYVHKTKSGMASVYVREVK